MSTLGPIIQVNITQPKITQEYLNKAGKTIPTINVNALIDTGAYSSVITHRVADELGLIHTGYQKVSSVQDQQERPVYYGYIQFPWGMGKEIPFVSCPLVGSGFDCLIGRDILKHWHFTYHGTDGSLIICD